MRPGAKSSATWSQPTDPLRCAPPHRQSEHGFTIIEMLVSLTILAVILGVLGGGLRILSQNSERSAERISTLDMLSRAFDILRRDVSGLQRLTTAAGKSPRFIFTGTSQGMSFVTLEPPYPTAEGPYFVSYSVQAAGPNADLIRARAPYQSAMRAFPGATPANRVPLLQGPLAYQFAYGRRSADGVTWYTSWPYPTRLPQLLRLEIIDPRTKQRIAPQFIAAVRADAEIGCLEEQAVLCSAKSNGELMASLNVDSDTYITKK